MYDELYRAWKQESISHDLQKLDPEFCERIAAYFKRMREESRMLDRNTMKAKLLGCEQKNARRMLLELAAFRYRKIARVARSQSRTQPTLLIQEQTILSTLSECSQSYHNRTMEILQGRPQKSENRGDHENVVVRFIKDTPAFVGLDMKTCGPFKGEDVATIPSGNSAILLKQHFVQRIETA